MFYFLEFLAFLLCYEAFKSSAKWKSSTQKEENCSFFGVER